MKVIPASYEERTRLRGLIAEFAEGKNLVPPVALHVLEELADEFVGKYCVHVRPALLDRSYGALANAGELIFAISHRFAKHDKTQNQKNREQ